MNNEKKGYNSYNLLQKGIKIHADVLSGNVSSPEPSARVLKLRHRFAVDFRHDARVHRRCDLSTYNFAAKNAFSLRNTHLREKKLRLVAKADRPGRS